MTVLDVDFTFFKMLTKFSLFSFSFRPDTFGFNSVLKTQPAHVGSFPRLLNKKCKHLNTRLS